MPWQEPLHSSKSSISTRSLITSEAPVIEQEDLQDLRPTLKEAPTEDYDPWDRIDVRDWEFAGVEQIGTHDAEWICDHDDHRWLYKPVTIHPDGSREGEDWAEVMSAEIATLLQLPHAQVRLCTGKKGEGIISKSVIPRGFNLHSGALWLEDYNLEPYLGPNRSEGKIHRVGHSLTNIKASLANVEPPPYFNGPRDFRAFDVFAGYLCLDAIIANRDRHEENWAVLEPVLQEGTNRLSPSFDHARAFGSNLQDDAFMACIGNPQRFDKFLLGGTAHRLQHSKPPGPCSLAEAAATGLSLASQRARKHWKDQVDQLDADLIDHLFDDASCSQMGVPARTMGKKLIRATVRRLQDAITQHQ